ncbi:MAG: cytochrome c [Labilithrix sp.]|nr:cytochrome c [Labilithrix sp.]MCW5832576.1 cytochrome c [Labilithrix sp.]
MTKRTLAYFVTVAAMTTAGCADKEESPSDGQSQRDAGSPDDSEDPGGSEDPDDSETLTLSASFQAVCAKCHGAEGRGQGGFPSIPGGRSESAFIAIVRSGRGEMPASDASKISDADLASDYLWLTTKRP